MYAGEELRLKRKAAGLTQRALANMLAVTSSAVGQWETGASSPGWRSEQKLAEILDGVTPDRADRVEALESEVAALRTELDEMRALIKQLSTLSDAGLSVVPDPNT